MSITPVRESIRLTSEATVFTLPERVAFEEGLFERHGVDVQVADDWDPADFAGWNDTGRDVLHRFEADKSDTFNLCEWGSIDRVEKAVRPARIAYLRPAVVSQAIVSFRPEVQEPHDLGGVTVGIHEFTGQHYTALQLLEGALTRDRISVADGGDPERLLEHLESGAFEAVALMEPFISLALKKGAHIVAQTFYRGGQIFGENVTPQAVAAYVSAINAAVDHINSGDNFARYRSYIADGVDGRLEPEELSLLFYRYVHAKPFDERRFEETYAWMRSWGLAKGGKTYSTAVNAAWLA